MAYEDILAALGDPTRRRILELLHAGPRPGRRARGGPADGFRMFTQELGLRNGYDMGWGEVFGRRFYDHCTRSA